MTTALRQTAFETRDGITRVLILRTEIDGDQIHGIPNVTPFQTLVKDDPEESVDRRRRLADRLDTWAATVTIDKSHGVGLIETMGEGMEPYLTLSFARSVTEALEGHIYSPLGRFAALGVAQSSRYARASIGEIHSADTLDELAGKLLIGGMGLPDIGWEVTDVRYLVMNLDRDTPDPSLNLGNLIDGLPFSESNWPEA